MPVREVDPAWERYHRSLLWQIARRDADYTELHHDYMELQRERDDLRGMLFRMICRWLARGVRG